MNEYNKYGEKLEEKLRLNTYPLAIKMLKNPEEVPSEAIRPLERFGKCLSTARALK
ncbi:hypothetical protein MCGE09_00165 [Thaumarchaeota archaeon SCGC AB-539-E09]|nr:hypothetical protein MCGE09_00165 [Thaumarchaeota archaeon SCGC AB-539-E09]